MSDISDQTILSVRDLCKGFPGVQALQDARFELRRGEVHALLGENGAGKSTLIKVLTGVYRPDAGVMTLDGVAIQPATPRAAERLGISTVYQEVNLIPQLSVAENLSLGRFSTRFGLVRWGKIKGAARDALKRLGIAIDVSRAVNSYSIAIQQMVAIARAVGDHAQAAKVLILDEPTSSLDTDEVAQLFRVMDQLRIQGLGIVFVTHFLDQVYRISDRITVLRNGRTVGQWNTPDFPRLSLVGAMVGKELSPENKHRHSQDAVTETECKGNHIRVQGLAKRGMLGPITFEIGQGQIVGLAGLLGSGRTEAARLIFGSAVADTGHVEIGRQRHRFDSPRQAIRCELAMTSEDRKANGIFPNLSVCENIVVALQAKRGVWRRLSQTAQAAIANEFKIQLGIKTPNLEQSIGHLSGGNQQKCLLGRWLATCPSLLILDEPTRGIDVGAKAEIRLVINDLCAKGLAVLFISSELEEVADLCDRIVVLRDREQLGEIDGHNATQESILTMIAHGGSRPGSEHA